MPANHHLTWSEIRAKYFRDSEVAAACEALAQELDSMEPKIPAQATCAICRWYTGTYESDLGYCRRYAPNPTWPLVHNMYLCGEWVTDYESTPRSPRD